MDRDTTTGWIKLLWLPLVVFLGGLLITALLWIETREALQGQAEQTLERIHHLQAQRLQQGINTFEGNLEQLANQLPAENPEALLGTIRDPMPGWQALAVLDNDTRVQWQYSIQDELWAEGTRFDAAAHWRGTLERARNQGAVATSPRFEHPTRPGDQLQALVWPLPGNNGEAGYLIASFSPVQFIQAFLGPVEGHSEHTAIVDLDQHDHRPIFQSQPDQGLGTSRESELGLGDRRWLMRSQITPEMAGHNSGLIQGLPLGGAALSIALALLLGQMRHRQAQLQKTTEQLQKEWDRDRRALDNKHLEKEVLSRALSDSEQRTRDFVELGEAIGFELDDQATIGYVSPQAYQLLGRPPTEVAGMALAQLLPEPERARLRDALRDCRREATAVLLDTQMHRISGQDLPVRLRMITITDALSHCQGYRVVAWPRASH